MGDTASVTSGGILLPHTSDQRSPISPTFLSASQSDGRFVACFEELIHSAEAVYGLSNEQFLKKRGKRTDLDVLFGQLLDTDVGQLGVARLDDDKYSVEETGDLYEDGKVVCGARSGEWELIFSKHSREPQSISTVPQCSIVYCISSLQTLILKRFKLSRAVTSATDAACAKLQFVCDERIESKSTFLLGDPAEAIQIVGRSGGAKFARIVGRLTSPLTHSFCQESQKYLSSSFANDVVTGKYFFVHLLKSLLKSSSKLDLSGGARKGLVEMFEFAIRSDEYPPGVKWEMVQIMSKFDSVASRIILESLSKEENSPLFNVANKALDQLKES